jgi:spore coat protein CotH
MRKKPLLFCLSFLGLSLTLASCTNPFDFGSQNNDGTSANATSVNPNTSNGTAASSGTAATGTSATANTGTTSAATSTGTVNPITGEVPATVNDDNYNALWTYGSDIKLSLKFTNTSLYYLSHYTGPESGISTTPYTKYYDFYFPADLTLTLNGTDYVLKDVGVREKGNNTRTNFCDSSGNISSSTHTSHLKVCFDATFETESASANSNLKSFFTKYSYSTSVSERKDRTLFGLGKLDLKYFERNSDLDLSSGLRYEGVGCYGQEIYCYDAFRQEGVIAPHANSASLTLSTDADTVTTNYEIIETIDKKMLKRYYSRDDSQGDLYKCTWSRTAGMTSASFASSSISSPGTGDIGIEDNVKGYHPTYDLKTNDSAGASSDFSKMSSLITLVNNAANGKVSQSSLEAGLDVDQFLKFSAVSACLGNYDDYRYSYNNYYLYFVPSTGKAIYIPYDYDWSLGSESSSANMATRGAYDETSCQGSGTNANPIFKATIFKNSGSTSYSKSGYQKSYSSYISQALSDGILTSSNYQSLVGSLKNVDHPEYSTVSSYMSSKTSILKSTI